VPISWEAVAFLLIVAQVLEKMIGFFLGTILAIVTIRFEADEVIE